MATATYIASKNLAEIREQLGEPFATALEYLPLDKVITKTQKHEEDAISFMLLFGHIRNQCENGDRDVWVLLFPPTKEDGQSKIEFNSYDSATGASEWHNNHNISTSAENAAAFKMPKKASLGKHTALARYYFLQKLAANETKNDGISELKFAMKVNRGLLDCLKTACNEFEGAAKAALARSVRQLSVTLPESQESDATLDFEDSRETVNERLQRAWVPFRASYRAPTATMTTATATAATAAVTATTTAAASIPVTCTPPAHQNQPNKSKQAPQTPLNKIAQALASLNDKEMNVKTRITNLDDYLMTLTEERLDLEQRCKNVEAERLAAEKEVASIKAQRETLFKGLSPEAVFELGRNSERTNPTKRRKLD